MDDGAAADDHGGLLQPMASQLLYFRPGEEARMLARCQFGIRNGRCGATMTYPIKGYPWRNNPMKSYEFYVNPTTMELLFLEVPCIRREFPDQYLSES